MSCRLDALNTILNKSLSKSKFNEYCDEFDKEMNFEIGTSREYFIVGKNMQNIFSYILKHHDGAESFYIPMSNDSFNILNKKLEENSNLTKLIVFNKGHAWAMLKHKDRWYKNLKKKHVKKIPKDCGYVIIY